MRPTRIALVVAMATTTTGLAMTATPAAAEISADDVMVVVCGYPFEFVDGSLDDWINLNDGLTDNEWSANCEGLDTPHFAVRSSGIGSPFGAYEMFRYTADTGPTCTIDVNSPTPSGLNVNFGGTQTFPGCELTSLTPATTTYTLTVEGFRASEWLDLGTVQFGIDARPHPPAPTGVDATGLYSADPDIGVIVVDADVDAGDAVRITVTGDDRTRTFDLTGDQLPKVISRLKNGVRYTATMVVRSNRQVSNPASDTATPYSHPAAVRELEVTTAQRIAAGTKVLTFRPGANRGARIDNYRARCSKNALSMRFTSTRARIALKGLPTGRWTCTVQAHNKGGWGDKKRTTVRR